MSAEAAACLAAADESAADCADYAAAASLEAFALAVAYAEAVAALATILVGWSATELTSQPEPGEWSAVEVLCHLRDVEQEVNLVRLEKVMESENPFIAGQDTDRWAIDRQYILQDCLDALGAFQQTRIELLARLEALSEEDWQRPVRHAIFGPTRLVELINIIAGHDRLHVRQVMKALNAAPSQFSRS